MRKPGVSVERNSVCKNWRSMVHTVCHALTPMPSYISVTTATMELPTSVPSN